MVIVERLIDIGEGLRLDALRRIDDQQRAFTGGQTPADLIGEIDMTRRVHQVQLIGLAVFRLVFQPDGLRLDGNAALALNIHAVEDLLLHLAQFEAAANLDQPVGQRRFPMIDMGDDREIANMGLRRHGRSL